MGSRHRRDSAASAAHAAARSRSGRTCRSSASKIAASGIDADDRKHIFEPFYRGREAVSQQIQGSGLGLNLVLRIAEAHGGRVTLTSEPGKGSTFTLALPAVTDRAARTRTRV